MKRILFISNNNKFGGSEVLWLKLAHLLLNQGFEIGLAIFPWKKVPDTLQRLIDDKRVRIFYRKEPGLSTGILNRVYKRMATKKQSWESFRPQFAIISLGSHLRTLQQPYYCKRAGVPYSIIFQLVTENSVEAKQTYCEEISGAVKNYFASQQNKELLERQLAEPIVNAKIIFNSFQTNDSLPFVWPHNNDVLNLAMVCRLDSFHKGLDLIFDVLQQAKWKERNIRFRIYGEGFSKLYLLKLKDHYGLSFVSFEGHRDNVEDIWEENHALVLPSRYEGMSLALIEAMLFGRVCIATDVGGAREIIEHGVNGFIASAPVVHDIDKALEEAWQSRNQWKDIGLAAYGTIRKKLVTKPEHSIAGDVEAFLQNH